MNTTNKALIAALAVQAVLVVLVLGRSDSTRIGEAEPIVPEFVADKVERIEVYKSMDATTGDDPQAEPAVVLAKQDGTWVLSTHYGYPAGIEKLQTFFDKVEGLASRGPIATAKARQSQLHVAEDKYARKIVIHQQGRQEPIILYIGTSAGSGTTALRVHGRDGVHAVRAMTASSAPPSVVGWVNTTYFEVEEKSVTGITVENAAGTFSFERDGEGWKPAGDTAAIPVPEGKELNGRTIDNMVRQMALLKLLEAVDPDIRTGSPLATVTLKLAPQTEVGGEEVGASQGKDQYTFIIGPERDGRYVVRRADGAPPVQISMNKLAPLINFSPENDMFKFAPGAAPAQPMPGQTPAPGQMPAPGGASPHGAPGGASPHGAPAGGNPHGGAPAGGNPHGGAPAGGNPHGGSPH